MTNGFETPAPDTVNEFDRHTPDAAETEGRAARPRTASLLDDTQRAAFLSEWDAVQTGFVGDPQGAAEAAERLVATLADSVIRRVGEVADAVSRPADDTTADPTDGTTADTPESTGATTAAVPPGDEETWRNRLLRCREAFHLLIDS
ncbi:MAG: hypothetical protein HOW97_13970 [Catenulispora sp.]|nr:hypothetical protein [Catenulispora sp.]